jgi:glutamate--cysteine ligase
MSLDLDADQAPLTSVNELVAYFHEGERPRDTHLVGVEHEKLIYPRSGSGAVPYDGERGIGALLSALEQRGYTAHREGEGQPVIALMRGRLTVSLEPGGQFELSGTPFPTAREAHAENLAHLADVRAAGDGLRLHPVALGYRPFDVLDEMPWMPKTRYRAMRDSLPRRGGLAKNMMLMTATGQVSLDWADEADCVRKTVLAARLSPVLVALYANSPLAEGRPTGYLSYRSHIWTDVDPARCGFLPAMFDNSFSYRAYVDWALEAPLLFLRRRGQYLRPELTFGQLLEQGFEGQPASRGDWVDHLSTLFPEVRLKKVLEVRSADSVDPALTGALAALWRGLLYDPTALSDAARLLPPLGYEDHLELMETARRDGLQGSLHGVSLGPAAKELVAVAREGLLRLDPGDAPLLEPLEAVARSGRAPAQDVLEAWAQDQNPARLLQRFTA